MNVIRIVECMYLKSILGFYFRCLFYTLFDMDSLTKSKSIVGTIIFLSITNCDVEQDYKQTNIKPV